MNNTAHATDYLSGGDYSTIGSGRSVSSFSDAGTATSIVSLTVGPSVASILSGLSSKTAASGERSSSSFLWRDRTTTDETNSHHLDFQAGLL
jgi:hypothetical protein